MMSGSQEMHSCDAHRRAWFKAGEATGATRTETSIDLDMLREIRAVAREDMGGGGRSLEVSMRVEMYFGWPVFTGTYLSVAGEPIALHAWNILPGGAVLDCGRDQFGEDPDIGIFQPGDPAWRRYRMEWTATRNPSISPDLAGCLWSGDMDADRIDIRRILSGGGAWWLPGGTSPALEAFHADQRERDAFGEDCAFSRQSAIDGAAWDEMAAMPPGIAA